MIGSVDPTAQPPLGLLRRYLVARGWRREPLRIDDLELFVLSEDGSSDIEIVLPSSGSVADSQKRVAIALQTLSGLEDRPVDEVASAVDALEYDVLRARLSDDAVFRESILLPIAQGFLKRARRFLIASASAELSRGTAVGTRSATATEYGDSCRFGHTFRGSFGFSIESPVGPNSEPALSEPEPPPPFERRVVQRIARGFQAIQSADNDGLLNPLLEGYERGFSADMCDEFADLVESTAATQVSFEVVFSPEWKPAADVPVASHIEVGVRSVGVVRQAARLLRTPPGSTRETAVGRIIRLESLNNPADCCIQSAHGRARSRGKVPNMGA